jgi:hypothetical protein
VIAKQLPVGISDFKTLITDNYIYVDKTHYIYNLIKQGRFYFLSRPRRFGKSLLITTLKELFLGNKELFSSLWIYNSDYEWPKHPVIHLDFSAPSHLSTQRFMTDLTWQLENIAQQAAISLAHAPSLGTKLTALVQQLSLHGKVVILIDEYDHPLVSNLHNLTLAKAIKDILSEFFTVLKSITGAYVLFIFITGITKFSKSSLFSGMNNLIDISLKPRAALLLGYTKHEIEHYFKPHINLFVKSKNKSESTIMQEMEAWYNGYCFSADVP